MLYILQEKGGVGTRAVWGRQLEFVLTMVGYAVAVYEDTG